MEETAVNGTEKQVDVVIVGGGQAGLSLSRHLMQRGVDHVVLDRGRPGDTWRKRWDSFCLVTPNKLCRLPGFPYAGDDPDGFMSRDEIVDYVERFVASFDPPVHSGVEVERVRPADEDGEDANARFVVATSDGAWSARHVVIAAGTFQHPRIPSFAEGLSDDIETIHSSAYKNPDALADGAVLVVGSGQSGAQIVEDLLAAGRTVHLATGGAGRMPRRYRGRDLMDWGLEAGMMDVPAEQHPAYPHQRFSSNPHVSGRDGGHTIHLPRLARDHDLSLYGHLVDLRGTVAHFADDLHENLAKADGLHTQVTGMIDKYIEQTGREAPPAEDSAVDWTPDEVVTELDLREAGIRTIVWATGYRWDFGWIEAPVFDEKGYPRYQRGVTEIDGLYFLGLHWLHTQASGLFYGVGRDAEHIADQIAPA